MAEKKPTVAYGQKALSALALAREDEDRVDTLVEEMRRDAYVCLVERDIRATVGTAQVSVTANSTDPRALTLAVTLDELWRNSIGHMLECYAYGRQAFEIVWTHIPVGEAGVHTVLGLGPLPYGDSSLYFGEEGEETAEAQGIEVTINGEDPIYLLNSERKAWWLALDTTALNPYGKSRFKGAMEDVWRKRCDANEKLETFIRKYALGNTVVYAAPTRKGPSGEDIDQWKEIGEAFQDGDGGDVLIFPNEHETDPAGQAHRKIDVDRGEVGVRDGAPIMNLVKELGSEILLAAAIPPRTVLEGDSGSFALVTWQMLVKFAVVEDILSQIGQSFQKTIVEPAMALNGVTGVEWNYVPLTQRPDDMVSEIVKGWLSQPALSPLVTSGQVDVKKMLEMAGVPISKAARTQPLAQMAAPLSFRLWR